jgi:hypothetical protein
VVLDLVQAAERPPEDSPPEQDVRGDPLAAGNGRAMAVEVPGAAQAAEREEQAAEVEAVRDRARRSPGSYRPERAAPKLGRRSSAR